MEDSPRTILIVDDELVNLRLLSTHLRSQGYRVVQAAGGKEALAEAPKAPDLILLDIMMPGMDGFATLTQLRAIPETADTPVIFLSAMDDPDYKVQAFEAGGVDYVTKPFEPRELFARVRIQLMVRSQDRLIRDYADHLEEMVQQRTGRLREAEGELRRDYDIQGVLNELLRLSLTQDPTEDILDRTLESLFSVPWLTVSPKGSIHLRGDDGRLTLAAQRNFTVSELEACREGGEDCACRRCADQGRTLVLDAGEHAIEPGEEPHGHLCVPMTHGDRTLGVLNVFLRPGLKADDKERALMEAVANTLAGVVRHKRTEDQLYRNAYFDSLTGLPNRTRFTQQLEDSLSGGPCTVFVLGLDRFKRVNESLGHAVGDTLLRELASRLTDCSDNGQAVVMARLGGDEFALLFPGPMEPEAARKRAERINALLIRPVEVSGQEVFSSACIGMVLAAPDRTAAEVMRDADIALHQAKETGPGSLVVFAPEMHERAAALMLLANDMRRGLEREEFVLHYQPIVDLATGLPVGAEALVRWNHPRRGMIFPDAFIPVAEDTGHIVPLGYWVLRRACLDHPRLMALRADGGPFSLSVNISGAQMDQPGLVDEVAHILEATGMDPQRLKLEITETAVMRSAEAAADKLARLKALDLTLSIDDFGTGYSSLSYLHRFPVDMLKVDRSFVMRMDEGDENLEIVRTIIALARTLGMATLAEGIETEDQMAMLRALGCDFGQGYLFSRPLPLDVLLARPIPQSREKSAS